MNPERLAAIRRQWTLGMGLPAADVIHELLDELEAAQAETERVAEAGAIGIEALTKEVKLLQDFHQRLLYSYEIQIREGDAVQAENTRLRADAAYAIERLEDAPCVVDEHEHLEVEVDRLTTLNTDLTTALHAIAEAAACPNEFAHGYVRRYELGDARDAARELLARCSPNEETTP